LIISAFIRDTALHHGFDISALLPQAGATIPTCAALFDTKGSHTFLASNEEAVEHSTVESADFPLPMLNVVASSKALIVDGFALHSDRTIVRQSVETALEHETKIWVDPQTAISALMKTEDELFRFILDNADGLSLTADEAQIATGLQDLRATATTLGRKFCSKATTILLKDGERGCHTFCRTSPKDQFDYQAVPAMAVKNEEFRDSIGAGDSFLGAFLAGFVTHGLSASESSVLANAMGAATCMNHGAGVYGVGSRDLALELLSKNNASADLVGRICAKLSRESVVNTEPR